MQAHENYKGQPGQPILQLLGMEGGGGEGAALPHISYIGMCHCEGYGLGSVDWDMVQKSEIFGVEQGINFHETDQLLEFRDTKSGIG